MPRQERSSKRGGTTEKALPSAGQGSFEHLESGEGVPTLSLDLRFRNALSVRTDA